MKRFSQRAGYSTLAEVNITPLLDLCFVLLVIFMITTPLLEQGIALNLPTASASKTEVAPKSVKSVSVDRNGTIFLEKLAVTLPQLETALRQWKSSDPEASAVLRFDRDLKVQQIVDVFDALEHAGISRVALLNTPDPKKSH